MKHECDLVKDLMPLYHDGVASQASETVIKEHFEECETCKALYARMVESDAVAEEAIAEHEELEAMQEEQTAESFKKVKKKRTKKVVWIVVGAVLGSVLLSNTLLGIAFASFGILSFSTSKIEETTDICEYENYISGTAEDGSTITHWGMDISIWPEKITSDMNVRDYHYAFYNPWDAQYVGFVDVEYDEASYQKEMERLRAYESDTEYHYYDVTGFEENGYELVALDSDEYQGFIYALTDGKCRIIYVELVFCNYGMDFDYNEIVPKEFQPDGFDATGNGAYTKQKKLELKKEAWKFW